MIVSGLDSGMGNQMFQYANGYALARERNESFFIDISQFKYNARPYSLGCFNISAQCFSIQPAKKDTKFHRAITRLKRLSKMGFFQSAFVREKEENYYKYRPAQFIKNKSIYLSGFWQNYRYFHNYRDELKKEFSFNTKLISKECLQLSQKVTSCNSLAIHIRRGDYLLCDNWLLEDTFFVKALEIADQLLPYRTLLYVFCEDVGYVKKLLQNRKYVLVTEAYHLNDIEEFYVMSCCQHHIISNSTYSWWAAYLGDDSSLTIAPIYKHWTRDYYLPEWKTIDCNESVLEESLC